MYMSAPFVERLCFETFIQGGLCVAFKMNCLVLEARIAYISALAYVFSVLAQNLFVF